MSDTTGLFLENKRKQKMPSDMEYQKCEDRKIWTDWYCFNEREMRARLQVGKHADGDCFYNTKGACNAKPEHEPLTDETALDVEHESWCEGKEENCNRPELGVSIVDEEGMKFAGGYGKSGEKFPWERAPTGLKPVSKHSTDEGISSHDGLLVRRSSSTISSNSSSSFCDLPNNTTDLTPPSLSTQIAERALERPTPSLTTLLFSDPDPIDLDNHIQSSSRALDDPDIFDALLDACIEKTRALIAAAEEALRSSSHADFGRRNGLLLGDDDRVEGRYDNRARRGATMPEEEYPPSLPHCLISHSGSRNAAAVEARFDDDGNGALGCVREVRRGRAEAALKKEIVMVDGWWKVKDGDASWREIGADGCGVGFVG